MTRYNWNAIPKQYSWVAVDSHGVIRAFSERPVTACGYWVDGTTGDTPIWLAELPCVVSWKGWEDSLEHRPNLTNRYHLDAKRWSDSGIKDTTTNRYLTLGEVLDLLNERSEA